MTGGAAIRHRDRISGRRRQPGHPLRWSVHGSLSRQRKFHSEPAQTRSTAQTRACRPRAGYRRRLTAAVLNVRRDGSILSD